jgi:hypothetical protein
MGFFNFIKGLLGGKKESDVKVKEEKLEVLNEVVSNEVTEMTERLKDVSSKPLEKVESTSVKEIKSKSRTKKASEPKEKVEKPKEKKASKKPVEQVEKPKAEKTKKKVDKKS